MAVSTLTATDFFVAQKDLTKPESSKKEIAGTIGGPIVRDEAHFFYSLERIIFDEGRSNNFPDRPELDYADVQKMRLWNNLIRFDHQINADNTWDIRHIREDSPLHGRITPGRTDAARDHELDIDHTTVGSWNAVIGNNKVNTLRVGWAWETNGFTSEEVRSGQLLVDLQPTLRPQFVYATINLPDAERRRHPLGQSGPAR